MLYTVAWFVIECLHIRHRQVYSGDVFRTFLPLNLLSLYDGGGVGEGGVGGGGQREST